MKKLPVLPVLMLALLASCTAPYEQELPEYTPELVVEAYVNQSQPLLTYALVSRSIDYYNPDQNTKPIENANVQMWEGTEQNGTIIWDEDNPVSFQHFEGIPGVYLPGLGYVGKENHYYRIEVEVDGETITATSYMPEKVEMDSFYYQDVFNPQVDSTQPFSTMFFRDPADKVNYYLLLEYSNESTDWPPLWGSADRIFVVDDELFNGSSFGYSDIFPRSYGDTVNLILAGIDEGAFRYWESYENSQGNGGPFSQPINVISNFDNGRGLFSAMAVDKKRIIITKP